MHNLRKLLVAMGGTLAFSLCSNVVFAESYSFGVLSQRSAILTAQYWNPILEFVKRKTGIELLLKVARNATDSNDSIERGEFDFVYSNTIFLPTMAASNYQVILRPRNDEIAGQIVTLASSPIRSIIELEGKEVGFPSPLAFVGFALPMDHLQRQGIKVTPVFGGNQEGIMGQLEAGRVIAAGVNSQVMKDFAIREGFLYRVLWESESYHNLPISVHPRVPAAVAQKVRSAIDGMDESAEGMQVLKMTGEIIGQKPPYGFSAANQGDYRSYQDFYKKMLHKEIQ